MTIHGSATLTRVKVAADIAPVLSVVIPAYQEESRIAKTLSRLCEYLTENYAESEIIVVCNSCTDRTADIARGFKHTNCKVRVLEIPAKGKGIAVKTGVLAANGDYILFTDADSAYEPVLFNQFVTALANGADVAIAERQTSVQYHSLARRTLAQISAFVMSRMLVNGIRDTQAGLKAFSRNTAHTLFTQQTTSGFAFDIELLLRANKANYTVQKVSVPWSDEAGSSVRLWHYAQGSWSLIQIVLRLAIGR